MLPDKKSLLYFILVLFLSITGNFLILKNARILQQHLSVWYILHIVWMGSIVFAGYACWKDNPNKWLLLLWLSMYVFAVFLFFLLGAIDVFLYKFPYGLRKDISLIRLFFFGPVPFVIIYFISRIAGNTINSGNN